MNRSRQRAALLLLIFGSGATEQAAQAEPLDHFATTDDVGLNKVPHTGESHVLVVPHRSGKSEFPATRLADLQRIFNPAGGPGTFRDFWRTTSNGRYDPIPTLAAPVLYPTSCPLPGKDVANCKVAITDLDLIGSAGLRTALEDILRRVRDEQQLDLAQFDVNGATVGTPDGFFDGLILDSDIYSGIGFPLAVLNNDTTSDTKPGGGGSTIKAGIVAMIPPALHEYGHNLGFVDLYGGPPVNCLMNDMTSTLSAFSRLQIGWGEVVPITKTQTLSLRPVLDGGAILRVGQAPRYVLIENRGGPQHAAWEGTPAGVNVYSVDEDELPRGTFGFLDVANQALNLPNKDAPYLNVNLPVNCDFTANLESSCMLSQAGLSRQLVHASGTSLGFELRIGATASDGAVTVTLDNGELAGCSASGARPADSSKSLLVGLVWLLGAVATVRRRRSRRTAAAAPRRS